MTIQAIRRRSRARACRWSSDEQTQLDGGFDLMAVERSECNGRSEGSLQVIRPRKMHTVAGTEAELLTDSASSAQESLCHGDPVTPCPVLLEGLFTSSEFRVSQLTETTLGCKRRSSLYVGQPLTGDLIGFIDPAADIPGIGFVDIQLDERGGVEE